MKTKNRNRTSEDGSGWGIQVSPEINTERYVAQLRIRQISRNRKKSKRHQKTGGEDMCEIIEKLVREGIMEARLDLARKAIIRGKYPLEEIAELFHLPLSDIEALARDVSEERASGSPEV